MRRRPPISRWIWSQHRCGRYIDRNQHLGVSNFECDGTDCWRSQWWPRRLSASDTLVVDILQKQWIKEKKTFNLTFFVDSEAVFKSKINLECNECWSIESTKWLRTFYSEQVQQFRPLMNNTRSTYIMHWTMKRKIYTISLTSLTRRKNNRLTRRQHRKHELIDIRLGSNLLLCIRHIAISPEHKDWSGGFAIRRRMSVSQSTSGCGRRSPPSFRLFIFFFFFDMKTKLPLLNICTIQSNTATHVSLMVAWPI